ncbi:MAG: hypothetical protein EOO77_34725 [Oxalobacteraceae bacterium]|nr:MAG: hypothetical protein EOO77_34725 [Oxalobacteraceae bacterium]
MGKRINIDSFDDLVAESKQSFLDGIIRGEPIAKNVGGILSMATMWGGDEAEREEYFFVRYNGETMDDLRRDAVRHTVERMFGGDKMDSVVDGIARMGAAFGFQNIKKAMAKSEEDRLDRLAGTH